ncbi:MAG: alpha-galactosidase [Oscillospiraceae bacterium]|nr:alpha-galactosidase [Oscillospiraceae bacterium]
MKSYISTQEEIDRMYNWFESNFLGSAEPPFSFNYSGKRLALSDKNVKKVISLRILDSMRTEYNVSYNTDFGLCIKCVAVLNKKYAECEWKLYLKNVSDCDSDIISELNAIDTVLFAEDKEMPVLYHFDGDNDVRTGYRPSEQIFYKRCEKTYCNYGGRPTNLEFPYYRFQNNIKGCYFILSWQGQWETTFSPIPTDFATQGVRIRGKQQNLTCRLHPDETIVSPMAVLYFYDGCDDFRTVNLWRHWFIECNMPHPEGKLIPPFFINYSGKIFYEMIYATEQKIFDYIDKYADNGINFDYLWLDAGWYDMAPIDWWHCTGTWKVDKKRFPNGIRALSVYARKRVGAKTMLWFEPERANPGTEIYEEHPEWCLKCAEYEDIYKKDPGYMRAGSRLVNIGIKEAQDFIVNRIDSLIKSEGLSIYREDFNFEPYNCWAENEEPERTGILENHYCTGFLEFYDRLLEDNPGLFIDNCASGGRRNDLETMRRSIPLHKTDYDYSDTTVKHGFHHSLFQWFPFFGSFDMPADQKDIYYHRSCLLLSFSGCDNVFREGFDFELLKKWMEEWKENAYCLYGDYYPVTPYSIDDQSWIGWQFDLPVNDDLQYLKGEGDYNKNGEGMLQLFMRKDSPYKTAKIKLHGLQPRGIYSVKNYNTGIISEYTGNYLMNDGLEVEMTKSPDSALYHYTLIK